MADKIRIYSKKAFAIGPGAMQGTDVIEQFITVRGTFQDMPAAFVDDPTFKLAVSAGDIMVINKENQKKVENQEFEDPEEGETEADPIAEKVQSYYEELKSMKADEVEEAAKQYGAEFDKDDKLKNNKKRVLEAYKIWVAENNGKSEEAE